MQRDPGRPGAREGDAPGDQGLTIESYFKRLLQTVSDHPLVVEVTRRSLHTSLERGYARLVARLVDGSQLHIFEYIDSKLRRIAYAYHYQDPRGHLVFRYDNEPHYAELATFPHHKHASEIARPSESIEPSVETVLEEVTRTRKVS